MSWNQIQKAVATGDLNSVTTAAKDMTGADLFVLVCTLTGVTISTPTDSTGSNTYSSFTIVNGDTESIQIFYCFNPVTSATQTFTLAQAASFPDLIAYGYSGAAASPNDKENGSSNGSGFTSWQVGAVDPTPTDGELIVAGIAFSNAHGGNVTIDSGFASPADAGTYGAASVYVQPTAASINPTFSWTNSVRPTANIVSFKPSTGGSTPKVGSMLMMFQ